MSVSIVQSLSSKFYGYRSSIEQVVEQWRGAFLATRSLNEQEVSDATKWMTENQEKLPSLQMLQVYTTLIQDDDDFVKQMAGNSIADMLNYTEDVTQLNEKKMLCGCR